MSRVEYLNRNRRKKKYNNHSAVYNGRRYDSIKEANYAEELDWRIKAGEIKEVIPQFKADLRVNDKHVCNYYVDFKVILPDGEVEFHEVKGGQATQTALWKLKWKLFGILMPEIEENCDAKYGMKIIV